MTGERLDEFGTSPNDSGKFFPGGTAFTNLDRCQRSGRDHGHFGATIAPKRSEPRLIHSRCLKISDGQDIFFPLRACPGGVLERRGQTEAAVDLPVSRGCIRRE